MTLQLDLAATAVAGAGESGRTTAARNGRNAPGPLDSASLSAEAPEARPSETGARGSLEAAYDRALTRALAARSVADVDARFAEADRAMVRLQREGRSA